MNIRKLEWTKVTGSNPPSYHAVSPFGLFTIALSGDIDTPYRASFGTLYSRPCKTLEEAQEYLQGLFEEKERAVRAALLEVLRADGGALSPYDLVRLMIERGFTRRETQAAIQWALADGILRVDQAMRFELAEKGSSSSPKKETFAFVVARLQRRDELATWDNLCIYSYGGEIQRGTEEAALGFLGYVEQQERGELDPGNPYRIYRLYFEPLEEKET